MLLWKQQARLTQESQVRRSRIHCWHTWKPPFILHSLCTYLFKLVGTRCFLLFWPQILTPMPLLSRWPWAGYLRGFNKGPRNEIRTHSKSCQFKKSECQVSLEDACWCQQALLKQRNSSIFSGDYTFPYSSLAGAGCNSNSTRLSRFKVNSSLGR